MTHPDDPPAPPLSILVVVHDFALGGTERIALRLARAWAAAGAEVALFCGQAAGPLSGLAGPQVTIVAADPPIVRTRGSRRRLAQAARRHAARHRTDIAFVPGNFHWPVVPALTTLGRELRPRIVAQVSASLDKSQRGPLRQALFAWRMRRLLRGADALTALSDRARDQANLIVGRDLATTIALPALDDATPPPLPIPDGPPLLVAAGRLVPEKGFADLVDALALLAGDVRLRIAGDGADRARLTARALKRGVADRVDFAGYLPDIRPMLDDARLFVLASHFEGFPAVLIEAFAAGRPVVATDCTPATALIADPAAGRVVPIGDPRAMAAAIAAMLAQPPPDPAALAARVAGHRIGAVARAYLDLFATLAR